MTGIVLLNKPKGLSSNTAANIVKAVTGSKKAGHLGTLDVEGEGVLPITLDKATCLFDYYLTKDKVYIATFEFGYLTDTLDLEGQVIARDEQNRQISQSDIEKVIPSLIGTYPQMPPAYSAKKINGKKAYDLARAGKEINLKPKEISVYSIKILNQIEKNIFEFEIHCSSGTYIRSIARDMGEKLSTYGIMRCILRTRCGKFKLEDCNTLEEIKNGHYKILKLENLFDYPSVIIDKNQKTRILQGVNITLQQKNSQIYPDGLYKLFYQNTFLGVAEIQNARAKFKYRFV